MSYYINYFLNAIMAYYFFKANRIFFLTFFILKFNGAVGQITWDTTRAVSRHEGGYGKFKPSIKATIFYNGALGVQVERVRNNFSLSWITNNTMAKHYGISWAYNKHYKYGLTAITAGVDVDFTYLHFGISGLVQTDFSKVKYSIIPEVGLARYGTLGVFYGYKIVLAKSDFEGNTNYLLGLRYNFTKDLKKTFTEVY
jgi:hypothetical protein